KRGHLFFNTGQNKAISYFIKIELRRLHRRFGHPCIERLYKMLTTARHEFD
ncbi:hypothetical protein BU23DRAFT_494098, partial [Bimuria novae-zelandiae CBS 107.79]